MQPTLSHQSLLTDSDEDNETFSSVSFSSCLCLEEELSRAKFKQDSQTCAAWFELLQELIEKLNHRYTEINSQTKAYNDTISDRRIWIAIHSGLYTVRVLKELKMKGMSMYTIIKAMKFGLISLTHCELGHFKAFKLDPYILEFDEMWSKELNDILISNLRIVGFSIPECWNIIIHGIKAQNSDVLSRLMLSGIDIPGILNWQYPTNTVLPQIIPFLKFIDIEEDVIQLLHHNGIDDEIEQLLITLGILETKEKCSNMKEIVYDFNIPLSKSSIISLETVKNIWQTSNTENISITVTPTNHLELCNCQCHVLMENATVIELTAQRNDYLRQKIMVPLSWAVARSLKYKPTNFLHYISYQLLNWTYNNVNQSKKDEIHECITLLTIAMDHKLIQKIAERNEIKKRLPKLTEKVPYSHCEDCEEKHIARGR